MSPLGIYVCKRQRKLCVFCHGVDRRGLSLAALFNFPSLFGFTLPRNRQRNVLVRSCSGTNFWPVEFHVQSTRDGRVIRHREAWCRHHWSATAEVQPRVL